MFRCLLRTPPYTSYLPAYLAAAKDAVIDEEHPHMAWSKAHGNLPAWQSASRVVWSILAYSSGPF